MNEIIPITNTDVVAIFNRRDGIFTFVCQEDVVLGGVAPGGLSIDIQRTRAEGSDTQAWKVLEKDITFKMANTDFIQKYNRVVTAAGHAMFKLNAAQQTPAELVKNSGPMAHAGGGMDSFWKSLGL